MTTVGVSGLNVRAGTISEEFNTELRSYNRRFEFYHEMTKDAAIATLLDCIKLPLLASEFTVVAWSEAPGDLWNRDFVSANLNGMYKQTWLSHVRDCLEALDYGFALSEIVLEKREDGYLYLRELQPIGQETLDRWEHDPQQGFTAFVQRDPTTAATLTVPLEKTVHVTYRGRKRSPEGESFLRPLYRTFKLKKQYEILEAIQTERDVGGMPVATVPEHNNYTRDTLQELDDALANMRRSETAYLRPPPGITIEPYSGAATVDIAKIVESLKMDIFFRGFAQFLTLGTTGVGTQALVQGDIDFFHLGLIALQQELLEIWNQQLIPYIFNANGLTQSTGLVAQPQIGLPRIAWADPGHTNIQTALEAYQIGAGVGLYQPNDADEDHFRAIHDLPPRTSASASARERSSASNPFESSGNEGGLNVSEGDAGA